MKYNFILGVYMALASLSIPTSTSAEPPSPKNGLEAKLENVRHGFWKEKYRADADLYIQSGEKGLPKEVTMVYSLCFEKYEPGKGVTSNCVAGKNEFLPQGLPKGGELHRRVNLQQRFSAPANVQGKKPKISVSFVKQLGSDPLYNKSFHLGETQDYKCDESSKSCPAD